MVISEEGIKRFESKIVKNKETGCHEWVGSILRGGYGQLTYKGKQWKAHRFSWLIHNGEIPKGEGYHGTCVLHLCDNRGCVNPDHLFLGTNQDNVDDKVAKNRQSRLSGDIHPMYDHTVFAFKHKDGRKEQCTQFSLHKKYDLIQANLSHMVLGKRPTVGGWSLA